MPYVAAILGALPNWAAAPGVVITAGSEAAGTPAANLANALDLPAPWRSAGLSPIADTVLEADLGQPRPVSSVYLVRHACRPGDSWRVRGSDAPIPTPPRFGPITVAQLSGTVTGNPTAIDDPVDDPTADLVRLIGAAGARITLIGPGDPLAGGEASQLLRLRVAAPSAAPLAPHPWTVAVGEGGSSVVVGSGTLTSSAETVLELPFPDPLSSGDRIDVEIESGGPGALDVVAIEWRPETVGDATPADTGWGPLVLEPELGLRYLEAGTIPEEILRLTTARHFLTTGPSGTTIAEHHHRYWRVDLRTPNHPRGYARASLLALGPAVPLGLLEGFTGPRVRDLSTTLRTADGTAYTRTGPVLAEATLPVDAASLEGPRDLLALRRFVGRAGRFGVSLLPEEAGAPALSFWGHLATDGGLDHEPGQMHEDSQQRGFHWLETLEVHEV